MSNILGVGVATLDIINTVESYPQEDAEVRATARTLRRGGNVTNTLAVLSQMKHACTWAGMLADDSYAELIQEDLRQHAILLDWAVRSKGASSPVSCICLSKETGQRTIVHYRDLPEFSYQDFSSIPLPKYDWIHFEGRNIEQTVLMLRSLAAEQKIPVSIEVEKPRDKIDALFEFADVLLFSRVYVQHQGYDSPVYFLNDMHTRYPQITMFCTWGDKGAYAIDATGVSSQFSAEPAGVIVDTIGAGDVFNAAVIHATLQAGSLQQVLQYACNLATRKCCQSGISGLV